MAGKAPPRYVPTLTDVVQGAPAARAPAATEEQLVRRVMQRVELTLDRRLREAVAATVLEHTRHMGPALQESIEQVVRQAVADALAAEDGTVPRQGK